MLAGLGYRAWAPNLRGYGNTDSPKGMAAYKLNTLVEDVAGLIRASGARETVVIAHDWGGMVAWTLAMRKPDLLHRLVVCNMPHPVCYLRELKVPDQILKSLYIFLFQVPVLPEKILRRNNAEPIVKMFLHTSSDPSKFSQRILDIYRNNALRPGGLTAMINWYRALVVGGGGIQFLDEKVPVIRVPTLLIWGDKDDAFSVRTTDDTERYVSDFTLRVLPGVSHWVQQEAPETVNSMLEAFLAGRPVPEATR